MANWLLDYIELTECVPIELREQLTCIRELDLQIHNEMDELERDIEEFFAKISSLDQKTKEEQYEGFVSKCDVALSAAADKVKIADKLHDLIEKSMRLLDQGLQKLKEDLIEGDKAYIVEELERRSQELDDQLKEESENMLLKNMKQHSQQQNQKHFNGKANTKNKNTLSGNNATSSNANNSKQYNNNKTGQTSKTPSNSTQQNIKGNLNLGADTSKQITPHQPRQRNNSLPSVSTVGKKKRERKRQLSTNMSIFNSNSISNEDLNQHSANFLTSNLPFNHLAPHNNPMLQKDLMNNLDLANDNLSLKSMIAGPHMPLSANDKKKAGDFRQSSSLSLAKQPVLTAKDAAHAVSPNATNSDKLILFSLNNPKSDIYSQNDRIAPNDSNLNNNNSSGDRNKMSLSTTMENKKNMPQTMLGNQMLASGSVDAASSNVGCFPNPISTPASSSSLDTHATTDQIVQRQQQFQLQHQYQQGQINPTQQHLMSSGHISLSSQHDPLIAAAASQAISATQSMTSGRRTSSLKASYAAVNAGRFQNQSASPSQPMIFNHLNQAQQPMIEVYCICRSHIQGSDMIACDNSECKYEWFHWQCVGITTPPEGEWYCSECRANSHVSSNKSNQQSRVKRIDMTTDYEEIVQKPSTT